MAKVVTKRQVRRKVKAHKSDTLQCGEALDVCLGLKAAKFQLIYCDPPFATGRRHRSRRNEGHEFDDSWASLEDYIAWLEPRVVAMRDLLKPSGVFALHLDWHAVHYAKVMCDRVFGYDNFVNEIIWSFRTGGAGKRSLARKHDTILVYGKTKKHAYYPQYERSYLSHKYGFSNIKIHEDEHGLYRETLMRDVWEIPALRGNQPESTGYPTQKPTALLERLISCFTKKNDTVADFFCGSGTTAVAARRLGRKFACSDASERAVELAQERLNAED